MVPPELDEPELLEELPELDDPELLELLEEEPEPDLPLLEVP